MPSPNHLPTPQPLLPNPFSISNPESVITNGGIGHIIPNPYGTNSSASTVKSHAMARDVSGGLISPRSENIVPEAEAVETSDTSAYTRTFGYGPMPPMPRFADHPVAALLAQDLSSWARGVENWARIFQGYIVQIEELLPIFPSNIHYSLDSGFTVAIDVADSPHARQVLDDALKQANEKVRELFSPRGLVLGQSGQWMPPFPDFNDANNHPGHIEDPEYGRGVLLRPGSIPTFHGPDGIPTNTGVATPTPAERGRGRGSAEKSGGGVKGSKVTKAPAVRKRAAPKKKAAAEGASPGENAGGADNTVASPTVAPKKKRAAPRKKAKPDVPEGTTPIDATPESNIESVSTVDASGSGSMNVSSATITGEYPTSQATFQGDAPAGGLTDLSPPIATEASNGQDTFQVGGAVNAEDDIFLLVAALKS